MKEEVRAWVIQSKETKAFGIQKYEDDIFKTMEKNHITCGNCRWSRCLCTPGEQSENENMRMEYPNKLVRRIKPTEESASRKEWIPMSIIDTTVYNCVFGNVDIMNGKSVMFWWSDGNWNVRGDAIHRRKESQIAIRGKFPEFYPEGQQGSWIRGHWTEQDRVLLYLSCGRYCYMLICWWDWDSD